MGAVFVSASRSVQTVLRTSWIRKPQSCRKADEVGEEVLSELCELRNLTPNPGRGAEFDKATMCDIVALFFLPHTQPNSKELARE